LGRVTSTKGIQTMFWPFNKSKEKEEEYVTPPCHSGVEDDTNFYIDLKPTFDRIGSVWQINHISKSIIYYFWQENETRINFKIRWLSDQYELEIQQGIIDSHRYLFTWAGKTIPSENHSEGYYRDTAFATLHGKVPEYLVELSKVHLNKMESIAQKKTKKKESNRDIEKRRQIEKLNWIAKRDIREMKTHEEKATIIN